MTVYVIGIVVEIVQTFFNSTIMSNEFTDLDYWKGIVLLGLNNATYKIALGKALLTFGEQQFISVSWEKLSKQFLDLYIQRMEESGLPQQTNPVRLTVMERIVKDIQYGNISYEEGIQRVAINGFNDVIPRFQTIGTDTAIIKNHFYSFDFGKQLHLHDSLLSICGANITELQEELDTRWSLLEGAFIMNHEHWELANDVRDIYLSKGYDRKALAKNVPFLQAYQGNVCFYCGEAISEGDIHVDHVLPRQVLNHDEEWNLVLAHSSCNLSKSDQVIGKHFIEKLIARNENIMGSNHPWKGKIKDALGNTKRQRSAAIESHYTNVITVLGPYYWNGDRGYNPATDPFYTRLITKLNQ